jgi:hypothetical protein
MPECGRRGAGHELGGYVYNDNGRRPEPTTQASPSVRNLEFG